MEMEQTPILRCTIRIDGLQGQTWQGRVLARGAEAAFRSERELIKVVEALLDRAVETGPPPEEARPSATMKKEELP